MEMAKAVNGVAIHLPESDSEPLRNGVPAQRMQRRRLRGQQRHRQGLPPAYRRHLHGNSCLLGKRAGDGECAPRGTGSSAAITSGIYRRATAAFWAMASGALEQRLQLAVLLRRMTGSAHLAAPRALAPATPRPMIKAEVDRLRRRRLRAWLHRTGGILGGITGEQQAQPGRCVTGSTGSMGVSCVTGSRSWQRAT